MSLSEIGFEVPIGEFQGFALSLLIFALGGLLFIFPDKKLESMASNE